MSYRQQLESVFTTSELELLNKLIVNASSRDSELTAAETREAYSIRDKLNGSNHISNPRTTAPSKL